MVELLVQTVDPSLMALPVGQRLFGTVKLPTEGQEHPSGQWSGVLQRVSIEGSPGAVFRLKPLVASAPFDLPLQTSVGFYRGPQLLGTLTVLSSTGSSRLVDNDTELFPKAPPRRAL